MRYERLGIKISRELANDTVAEADVLPVPAMRDAYDMEQQRIRHELVGATYYYLLDDDRMALGYAAKGLARADSFFLGKWEYGVADDAYWDRYRSSVNWSQMAIPVGYWAPVLGNWSTLRSLFDRLVDAEPDGLMAPEVEHEFVWAMGAYEAGQPARAIERVEKATRGKGADGSLLKSAFSGETSFKVLESFEFHRASQKDRNLYRKQSLVGGYVLHKFHSGSKGRLSPSLQDHLLL